jgi:hypothetical protein
MYNLCGVVAHKKGIKVEGARTGAHCGGIAH